MTASEALQAIYARVEKGIGWLVDHDPDGAFHAWYQAGITPASKKPAQPPEVVEAYAVYFPQRELFEKLWRQMVVLERKEGVPSTTRGDGFW